MSWQDLLKLLEGDAVHIAAPKTHFSKDIVMDKDIPVFAGKFDKKLLSVRPDLLWEKERQENNGNCKAFCLTRKGNKQNLIPSYVFYVSYKRKVQIDRNIIFYFPSCVYIL